MTTPSPAPLALLIAALGGEGGGMLMNWLVAAARQAGLLVQATSVPGVAQRTGSTSYYIEMLREPVPAGRSAVFALVPMPGRVDVVIASERVEAGRMMERGFVSPNRTTLILSTSRVLTTAEKIQMGDGRYDGDRIDDAARKLAQRAVILDLDGLARQHGTMVSATMFGALAGAGVLPWPRALSEAQIGDGRNASASRAGFAAAFDITARGADVPTALSIPDATTEQLPKPSIDVHALPVHLRDIAGHGVTRVTDFQDAAYGSLYLERLSRLVTAAHSTAAAPETRHGLEEAARRLALWMAYEDVPRVADLKTRPERHVRIRAEVQAKPGEVIRIVDYLKPGAEELAAMLPVALGERIATRAERGGWIPFVGKGLHLSSTSIAGNLVLRALAQGRRIRRGSLRWRDEQAAIEAWLNAMETSLARAPRFAAALAELPRLLKGYGDTHARGRANHALIFDQLVRPALASSDPDSATPMLRRALAAALADPERVALQSLLANGET